MATHTRGLRQAQSPSRIPVKIKVDDWESAIRDAMTIKPGQDSGKTMKELIAMSGKTQDAIQVILEGLSRDNRLGVGRRISMNIAGSRCKVPVYSIKEK